MSGDVLTQAISAGGTATFGRGRVFNVLAAPGGPISIVVDRRAWEGGQTQHQVFNNVPPGTKFTAAAGQDWTYLRVTSAVAQTITMWVGDEDLQFNNAVTLTGTAIVAINPSSAITTTGAVTTVANAAASTIAANPARRRITVAAAVLNTGAIYAQSVAAGIPLGGIPIAPGTFVEFDTTSAIDIRNDTGANQKFSVFEES
jgi:hypothetical protein